MSPITISAVIDAQVQLVWDCYTQGAHIIGWNFASDDWHCPRASVDLRVGGAANSRMEAKDGTFGFDLVCIYDAIEPLSRLSCHLEDGRKVETTFAPNENGTVVQTTFDPEQEHPYEMQRDGWQAILNNFKAYVERQ